MQCQFDSKRILFNLYIALHTLSVLFQVEQLGSMFDLDAKSVRSTVSKMLIAQELHACWDEDSTCIHVHHVEPTRFI